MKKFKWISLILAICLALQCLFLPAGAAETQASTQAAETTAPPALPGEGISQQKTEIPFGVAGVQNGCRTIEGMVPLGGSDRRVETAQSAFLYEVNTDTVIYALNPDVKVHPGVLAKIVLAMVILDNCKMEDVVTVTEGIQSYVPAGANKVQPEYLKSLEHISVGDLLYALILCNANDAAVALAHHVAGTSDACVTLMNAKAKQIGCTNTEFGNVSGLYTAESYSTAREIAKIMREAIKNDTLREILGTSIYTIPATDMVGEREFKTQNYLMEKSVVPDFYDTRVKGGMQSYHEKTAASLVCFATNAKDTPQEEETEPTEAATEETTEPTEAGQAVSSHTDMLLIGVILGATRTTNEETGIVQVYGNFNEMNTLLKYGFNNFKINRVIYEGMSLSQFAVAGGESNAVGQAMVNIDSVVPDDAQMTNLIMNFSVTGKGLAAPIKKDQLIATMQLKYRECVVAEAEVFAMRPVKAASDTGVVIHSTGGDGGGGSGFLSVLGTICVIVLGLAVAYLTFNAYMRNRMRARRRKRRAERRRNR